MRGKLGFLWQRGLCRVLLFFFFFPFGGPGRIVRKPRRSESDGSAGPVSLPPFFSVVGI